jgi:hypothetical protein
MSKSKKGNTLGLALLAAATLLHIQHNIFMLLFYSLSIYAVDRLDIVVVVCLSY